MPDSRVALNGDFSLRTVVDPHTLDWTPSPGGHVLRKRLHRVGQAESGQVTSLVRYEPGATFPAHDHPQGEEILVLEGVFS
ncbi:MAG: cupin domain-containing protein, partial [Haliea sp.]|nr:cupin domain-containing protein [Haliea sp.]